MFNLKFTCCLMIRDKVIRLILKILKYGNNKYNFQSENLESNSHINWDKCD